MVKKADKNVSNENESYEKLRDGGLCCYSSRYGGHALFGFPYERELFVAKFNAKIQQNISSL